ncbi:MAG: SUMF1/EgtB/PvdO family nonheme iron enzyme [Deltaproteobacteria bacterium]|nr:SUMF1/EgtB/PvdO family nonheme iron enzyme [Deltaproteobacteria bacterium]
MRATRPTIFGVRGAHTQAMVVDGSVPARGMRVPGALLFVLFAGLGACPSSSAHRCGDAPCTDSGGDGGIDASDDARPPDGDGGADGEVTACPPEMVLVGSLGICIDRFEASHTEGDVPASLAGVMPWNRIGWRDAGAACARAGKRLCLPDEWRAACRGPMDFDYPYGPAALTDYCNIAHVDYDAGEPILFPTATFERCEGGYPGLFDMIGNLAEWTDSSRYQEDAGGELALAVGSPYYGHWSDGCSSETWWMSVADVTHIGFRCCLTP